jgi:hypothetical protein
LRAALLFAGAGVLVLALAAWRMPLIRALRQMPTPEAPPDPDPAKTLR